jgi:hypothetical protein
MLIIPDPRKEQSTLPTEKILVIEECYCPNGHSLISSKAMFDKFKGIVFTAKKGDESGIIALSPVYGEKYRISLDLELLDMDIWAFHCLQCDVPLPHYKLCECGGELTTFFTSRDIDFNYSIAICNRVGCHHATIHLGEELLTQALLESY